MVEKSLPSDIDLQAFLSSAGQSFNEAQKSLISDMEVPVNMMLNNAELEIKVAVSSDAQGRMAIKPISSLDVSRGGIDPGVLSTLKISFVSTIGEAKPAVAQPPTAQPPAQPPPKRSVDDIVKEIGKRLNITRLEKTMGKLEVKSTFVPEQQRWLATVTDAKGKVVREIIVPDEVEENKIVKPAK